MSSEGRRSLLLALLSLAIASCAPTIHEDGFRATALARGCASEEQCRALIDRAKERWAVCETEPVASCEDAKNDYFATIDHQIRMRRRVEAAERRSVEQARRARDEARRAEELERASEADRERHVQAEASISRSTLLQCKQEGDMTLCETLGGEPSESCASECKAFLDEQREKNYERTRRACAEAVVDGEQRTPTCEFRPMGQPEAWLPLDRQEECSKACAALASKLRRYYATHARCCDGSRSPSCTYGRSSMSGCCSRHQGVCAEPEPE